MKGPKHTNAYKDLIAVISKADGTSGSWQRRMLDSDIYAEVKRDLKGEGIGKAKPATLKRLIRIAANRKQARDIEGLKTKRGRGDYARMREMLLDRPISLLSTSPGYMRLGIPRWAEQEIMRSGLRRYSNQRGDEWCKICHTESFSQLHMYMCPDRKIKAIVEPTIKLAVKLVSAMSIENGGGRVLRSDMPEEKWVAVMLGWIPPAKQGTKNRGRKDGAVVIKELSRNTKARAVVFYSQCARITRELYKVHKRSFVVSGETCRMMTRA